LRVPVGSSRPEGVWSTPKGTVRFRNTEAYLQRSGASPASIKACWETPTFIGRFPEVLNQFG
jgi:hypothetical protein